MPDFPPADAAPRPRRLFYARIGLVAVLVTAVAAAALVTELVLQVLLANSIYREVRRRPPHPFLQVLPSGQVDHVNAAGFRGDPTQLEAAPGTFRIFTIGGSTTLGVANPYEDSYPFLLQTMLRARHPAVRIEVQNAGAAWYTSAHDLVAYEVKVRRFKPDLVVFFEAMNDLTRSFSPPWLAIDQFKPDYSHYLGPYIGLTGPNVRFAGPPSRWLTWSYLRQLIYREPDPRNHRDPDNVARLAAQMQAVESPAFVSLPSFREYVDALIHAVQSDSGRIIVGSQPFLYRTDLTADERRLLFFGPIMCGDGKTYPSADAMRRGMTAYNDAAREAANRRGVRFVDFEAAVPKDMEHFSDDVHMRRPANEILARLVADAIDAEGLIRPTRPSGSR